MSSLAQFDNRSENIFINKVKSENGCYAVGFYIDSIPLIISIDDHFPSCQNSFVGVTSGEVSYGYKCLALAKIFIIYAGTIAGLPSEALSCLTNASCKYS